MRARPTLEIDVVEVGPRDVIALRGEIDIASSPRIAEALEGMTGKEAVLDLRGVEFMDSSGLKLLVEEKSRFEEAGGTLLLLVDTDTIVMRLLKLTHLADGFRIGSSIDELDSL